MAHDHVHHHDHEHDHEHEHGHGPRGLAFAVGIALNLGFVVVEVVYGLIAHSMALLADAGHNLGDVLALGVAWAASGQRSPVQALNLAAAEMHVVMQQAGYRTGRLPDLT